jgi:hypothetical protein
MTLTQIQYLWLKWWAESNDKSKSGTIRQLYLFIAITAANIVAYFAYFLHFAQWFKPIASLNMHADQLKAFIGAKFSCLITMVSEGSYIFRTPRPQDLYTYKEAHFRNVRLLVLCYSELD